MTCILSPSYYNLLNIRIMASSVFIAFIILIPTLVFSENVEEILTSVDSTIIHAQSITLLFSLKYATQNLSIIGKMEMLAYRARSRCAMQVSFGGDKIKKTILQLIEDSNVLRAEFERSKVSVFFKYLSPENSASGFF